MQLHHRVTEKCPIQLKDHQIEHVKKTWDTLQTNLSFISSAGGGLGKTHTTLCVAWHLQKAYGMKIMVVAPNDSSLNSDDSWLKWAKVYGIEIEIATTYSQLRGGQGSVSHDWLIPDKEDKMEWRSSPTFEKLCEKGMFLIFDEFHEATRKSITHNACAALVRAAKKGRCRIALLSYTPGDQEKHVVQILRMAGVIRSYKMFKYNAPVYSWEKYGLGELAKACKKYHPESQPEIEELMQDITAKKSHKICLKLYNTYIRPHITHAMPNPKIDFKVEMLNAFLETDEKSVEILEQGIAMLGGAVAWDNNLQQVGDQNQWSLANIGNALKMIEQGKLLSIARYVREQARKFPNKKFVISCGARGLDHHDLLQKILYKEYLPDEYKDIMYELKRKNENWAKLPKDMMNYIGEFLRYKVKPDVLNGRLGKKERVDVLRKFQKDSNDSWCLIISPGVGSEAISLHDQFGGREREMLIVPDYFTSRLIQSTCRIVRVGMKSDAKVLIVYSKQGALETSILNSMIRKSKTAKEIMAQDQQVLFPGSYDFWIQGSKDEELEQRLQDLQQEI